MQLHEVVLTVMMLLWKRISGMLTLLSQLKV